MAGVRLDSIDLMILQVLQEDGRISNVDLARKAGITPPPCLRRVRALTEAGYIRGYHAEIDAALLGYGVTGFVQIGLTRQAEDDLIAFEEMVAGWPEVRECYMLSGETDFLLKIVASDWDSYQNFLTTQLTPARNVSTVKSALSMRSAVNRPGVPIEPE